jgi:hypothetical protein
VNLNGLLRSTSLVTIIIQFLEAGFAGNLVLYGTVPFGTTYGLLDSEYLGDQEFEE